jgi:tetratricopeptide (TPR) repeat protein
MNTQLVEIYLDADNDVKNNNYTDAFRKYESILFEEPANAPSHNSLGWLYRTQLEDYKRAETHYKAAINGDPEYPHSYYHYAVLLLDMERYKDLDALLQKMLRLNTIEKAWVYHRQGLVAELKLSYDEAIAFFEKAFLTSLNTEKIKNYQEDIERCHNKKALSEKHIDWMKKLKA